MNPKKLGDNIEIMPVEVKPNELVLFYKNNKLVGEAGGDGLLFFAYDRDRGSFRTERVYVP